ncbi:hypothetical protein BHE74_00050090 [Ensete ventricosum]|nr:hypothetical protein BHE74_00050090 [Ensete ventricosum]
MIARVSIPVFGRPAVSPRSFGGLWRSIASPLPVGVRGIIARGARTNGDPMRRGVALTSLDVRLPLESVPSPPPKRIVIVTS